MSFAKHLECSRCGKTFSPRALHTLCLSCQSPLLVRYHLDEIRRRSKKTALINRPANMWRYHEVMPVDSQHDIVSLGEGYTPLLQLKRLGSKHGLSALYVKDESLNPTGTFKARGLSAAVSMARKLGVKKVAIPTAGNAGGALAAYGARAGMEVFVFMPKDTPLANVVETKMAGAHVELIDGLITDAARIVAERKDKAGWFDLSTLKEPYRIEGKKTMGYELAEQFQWQLPDVIVYPTGGGTGLIGMWKAFTEMEELGWIDEKRPRMVAVQSEGCAPIVKAFQEGKDSAEVWVSPRTFASGIRVPKAIGDFLILRALRQSRGQAVTVTDLEIYQAIHQVGSSEGLFLGPEGAACWTAVKKLRERQWIGREEKVVLLNTGSGLKYLDSLQHFEKQSFPGE
ncbi:threonine synthase [Acidobacteria bacterium AH-259-A15]|nr:threonine synthase [Acidobacteria bacterium AH-259-A15]